VLEGRGLCLRYGTVPLLDRVHFSLAAGEMVGLIGPNGAGKSTLLRILAGLQAADAGEVHLHGEPLAALPLRRRGQSIGYLEQGAPAYWPLAVRNVVALGRLPHTGAWQSQSASDREAIEQAMREADVHLLAERTVTTLSGGERLRVMLARIFATRPDIILADEPIAALDPYHQLQTMELLQQHCRRGGAAVVVLHDLSMAARFCQRLALLNLGGLVYDGDLDGLLAGDALAAVYGVHVRVVREAGTTWVLPLARLDNPATD